MNIQSNSLISGDEILHDVTLNIKNNKDIPDHIKFTLLKERLKYNKDFKSMNPSRIAIAMQKIQMIVPHLDLNALKGFFKHWHYLTKWKLKHNESLNEIDDLICDIFEIPNHIRSDLECWKCEQCFETFKEMQNHNEIEHKKKPMKRSFSFAQKNKFQINDPRDPLDVPPKEIPIGKHVFE